MDVLFNSIDIRDLLSTPDLDDPSTPLSTPDLHLLIDRLQVRSLHIKSKVHDYLRSHQLDFSSLFSQCSDVVTRTEQLSSELFNILNLISDHPVDTKIKSVIEEMVAKRKEVREKREVLELLGLILELCEKLRLVKEDIRIGRVEEAAVALRELKTALHVHNDEAAAAQDEESQLLAYGLLRKEWADCFDKLHEALMRFVESAVRFDQDSSSFRVKYWLGMDGAEKIELHTVLKAMDAVGILDYGLARVADLMIKHIIARAVSCRSSVSVVEEISEDQGPTSEAVLTIVSCTNDMFVPDDASKLDNFQKIVKLSSEFETDLKELMFISTSDNKDERLTEFANNVEVHFASRKKVEILAKARYMLLQAAFTIPQDHTRISSEPENEEIAENFSNRVVTLLFTSERCVVSEAALNLMELVHKTLKDVCLSSPRVGLEFYYAARDACLLYEAVVPVKLEKQLATINQAAVLMHNDCLYLAQEILGLAFEYRPDFPNPIKEMAVFADLAPRFQLIAEEILQRQIQVVIFNLEQAIDGAGGFQNTHLTKQYESAKFSIDQVAFILEKVHIIWEPLLMPSIYKRSMCMVLEVVFSRITKDILLLDDMAAEETLQLQRLVHLLFENLSSILASLLDIKQTRSSEQSQVVSVNDLIPSLQKLHKLEDLLDMPLKSITAAWESGELVSCGFTMTEVEDFIRAIFTDSPLRKECLFRMESSGFWK
ncbi:centromere/kinetochore protein zw10 homolog isoform X3 [Coffea arabica]|uniref:Centromere/kinetochore protein zw10 homolog isoform X3 n=1 Tax=Coffea arabica TaxID=13443 RepID=A0ABM4UH28_COFAR